MTATRSAKTRIRHIAQPRLLGISTLLLAAAIAIEVTGLRALDPVAIAGDATVVASVDGTAVAAPVATRLRKPAPVEVRVIAQADLPAR